MTDNDDLGGMPNYIRDPLMAEVVKKLDEKAMALCASPVRDTPDTIYVFWSKDKTAIRLWTADIERAKSFAEESGLEPQPFYTAYCAECNDGITAHDPGVCGTCYAMKYEAPPAALADREVK